MLPLLELRDALDVKDDRPLRDFRRMSGAVQLFYDRPIPGPYTQPSREDWLRRLLAAQRWVRENGPSYVQDIELITPAELEEVRRLWVVEKHELEDSLPVIYEECMGVPYPGRPFTDVSTFGRDELLLLRELCSGDTLHYQLVRELLDVQLAYRSSLRRAGLYEKLEKAFSKHFYEDEADAVDRARRLQAARTGAIAIDATPTYFEVTEGLEPMALIEGDFEVADASTEQRIPELSASKVSEHAPGVIK